jgi:MoxR-like ATPase
MATQNPIEQEGTYVLPEAQKDRFLMKIKVGYPSLIEERAIIRSQIKPEPLKPLQKIISKKDILRLKALVKQVYLDEKIEKYIVDIIHQTRSPKLKALEPLKPYLTFGASPRGGISLALVAKARAFMEGRAFVIPEDVKLMAVPVLNHRIGVSYEAEMDSISADDIIDKIIQYVEVP